MSPVYIKKLGFKTWNINVKAQKIDGSTFKTLKMIIADFWVEDKGGRLKFFQKTFLVANTKFEVILRISFLKINNANVSFSKKILQ